MTGGAPSAAGATAWPATGSPANYFWSKIAPERIRETLPGVRLIFSLREPAQRAFSIYHMNLRVEGHGSWWTPGCAPGHATPCPGAWVAAAKDLRSLNLDRSRMRMTEEEREVAAAFFREDVLRTQDLVGVDLSHWLRDAAASSVRKGRNGETEPTSRAARAAAP